MKNSIALLKIAGFVNLFFLMFHLPFYWMFGWEHSLSCLSSDNKNILLTFNVIGNILLLYFTFGLLRYSHSLLQSAIGKMFLLLIIAFYSVRIFAEFYFWGIQGVQSWIIIGLCALPVVCCVLPMLRSKAPGYVQG